MKVEMFATMEEAMERLEEARKAADARVKPCQAEAKPGDCFITVAEEDLVIFGKVLDVGEKGCLTLFGSKESRHRLFADHVAGSESSTRTEGHGRVVQEWRLRPGAPDNHWLDCLVGCAVAASMLGATLPGLEPVRQQRRKRYTQADLRRK